jgi:uncharacterized protein YxjI
MKHLKTYKSYSIDEEVNWKGALVGGALATGLVGCDPSSSNYQLPDNKTKSEESRSSNSFTMDQELLTVGMDMQISTGGRVEQRTLSFGNKFEYFDQSGKLKATAKQEVFSLGTVINISDESGNKIGSVEQEIIESMFSMYSKYSIKDASGKVIGKSDKLDFFTTNVDISDMSGGQITMSKAYLSIGDSWEVNINSSIDKRLIIFIPAFISLAQSEKSEESED